VPSLEEGAHLPAALLGVFGLPVAFGAPDVND